MGHIYLVCSFASSYGVHLLFFWCRSLRTSADGPMGLKKLTAKPTNCDEKKIKTRWERETRWAIIFSLCIFQNFLFINRKNISLIQFLDNLILYHIIFNFIPQKIKKVVSSFFIYFYILLKSLYLSRLEGALYFYLVLKCEQRFKN